MVCSMADPEGRREVTRKSCKEIQLAAGKRQGKRAKTTRLTRAGVEERRRQRDGRQDVGRRAGRHAGGKG